MNDTMQRDVLTEVKIGSREGWTHFYRAYAPLIRMHGRDCGVPEPDLDDLVQDVMTEFFRTGASWIDPDRGSFRSYLRRLIRFRSMDLLRRIYRERRCSEAAVREECYLDRRYDEEWLEYVNGEAMRRLRFRVSPERYREFRLMLKRDMDTVSVARECNAAPSAIYASFGRTRGVFLEIVRELELYGR